MQHATEERLVREGGSALIPFGGVSKTLKELAGIVSTFAASDGWMDRVRLRTENLFRSRED